MGSGEHGAWLQVNLSLFPGAPGEPYVPWAALAEEIERGRQAGRFERFYFMRKPPALRLRFGGPELSSRLEPALSQWLVEAERKNAIRSFRFVPYEPEHHRFGGAVGMAIAHDLFDGDSALVLRHESGEATVSRRSLVLAISHDLLRRSLDDPAEVWDVWKRLEGSEDAPSTLSAAARAEAEQIQQLASGSLDGPAGQLLEAARIANRRAALAIRAAASAGRLTRGVRSWLAAATEFQWNRWGLPLDLDGLTSAISAMVISLEPDQRSAEQ